MGWYSIVAIAVALAMDAFAVAIVSGLTLQTLTHRHLFRLAFHFGLFQSGMFVAGWYVGSAARTLIAASDHWIAFILLAGVGANIIRGGLTGDGQPRRVTDPTSGWQLVMLSFATSIDALAVGISLALIGTSITAAVLAVGVTAAAFTITGMMLGRRIGHIWGRRMELLGGVVLIVIGLKIVWDHVVV
jgi:manganese efflux pump family protein